MRKKTLIFILVEIVLIVYGYIAWSKTRGINIYLISYEMGKVFIYTYALAILLAIILMFIVIKLIKQDMNTHSGHKVEMQIFNQKSSNIYKSKKTLLQCENCGASITQTQKFCGKCGNKLGEQEKEYDKEN